MKKRSSPIDRRWTQFGDDVRTLFIFVFSLFYSSPFSPSQVHEETVWRWIALAQSDGRGRVGGKGERKERVREVVS